MEVALHPSGIKDKRFGTVWSNDGEAWVTRSKTLKLNDAREERAANQACCGGSPASLLLRRLMLLYLFLRQAGRWLDLDKCMYKI